MALSGWWELSWTQTICLAVLILHLRDNRPGKPIAAHELWNVRTLFSTHCAKHIFSPPLGTMEVSQEKFPFRAFSPPSSAAAAASPPLDVKARQVQGGGTLAMSKHPVCHLSLQVLEVLGACPDTAWYGSRSVEDVLELQRTTDHTICVYYILYE